MGFSEPSTVLGDFNKPLNTRSPINHASIMESRRFIFVARMSHSLNIILSETNEFSPLDKSLLRKKNQSLAMGWKIFRGDLLVLGSVVKLVSPAGKKTI